MENKEELIQKEKEQELRNEIRKVKANLTRLLGSERFMNNLYGNHIFMGIYDKKLSTVREGLNLGPNEGIIEYMDYLHLESLLHALNIFHAIVERKERHIPENLKANAFTAGFNERDNLRKKAEERAGKRRLPLTDLIKVVVERRTELIDKQAGAILSQEYFKEYKKPEDFNKDQIRFIKGELRRYSDPNMTNDESTEALLKEAIEEMNLDYTPLVRKKI